MRHHAILLATGIVAAMALVAVSAFVGQTSQGGRPSPEAAIPSQPDEGDALSHKDALSADAEQYAQEYDVSTDVAYERLAFQLEKETVVARLATLPSYSGAMLTHEPEFSLDIYLVGEQDLKQANAIVADLEASSNIRIRMDTTRVLTQPQIQRMVEQVDLSELKQLGEIQGVGYLLREDALVVSVLPSDDGAANDAGYRSINTGGMEGVPSVDVPVIVDYLPAPLADGYRGGFRCPHVRLDSTSLSTACAA
ncbi:MAG: hypothetical protein ACK5KU_08395 [Beutenbergiaceae bacterium]